MVTNTGPSPPGLPPCALGGRCCGCGGGGGGRCCSGGGGGRNDSIRLFSMFWNNITALRPGSGARLTYSIITAVSYALLPGFELETSFSIRFICTSDHSKFLSNSFEARSSRRAVTCPCWNCARAALFSAIDFPFSPNFLICFLISAWSRRSSVTSARAHDGFSLGDSAGTFRTLKALYSVNFCRQSASVNSFWGVMSRIRLDCWIILGGSCIGG